MRITRLQLKNFRKFENLDLAFDGGFNVVTGPNEQGKSTIVKALVAGLFYDPLKKPSAQVQENRRWKSDELYAVSLTFHVGDDEYLLSKDFENKSLLLRGPEGQAWKTFPEVSEKIAEFTGLSTPNLYESSALIRHNKISEIHSSKGELSKMLQELVTSHQEDVNILKIVRSLTREVNALKKGWDRRIDNPGPLRELADDVDDIAERLERAETIKRDVEKKLKENAELEKQIKELKAKQLQTSKLLKENHEFYELKKSIDDLQKHFTEADDRIRNIERLEEKIAEAQKQQSIFGWDVDRAEKTQQQLVRDHAVVQALEKDLEGKKSADTYPAAKGKLATIYFVLASIFGLVGAMGFFVNPLLYAGFIASLILIILGVTESSRAKASVVVDVSGTEKKLLQELKSKKVEMKKMLQSLDVESFEAFEKKYSEFQVIVKQERESELRLSEVLQGKTKEELQEARSRLASEKMGQENAIKELDAKKQLDVKELSKLEVEAIAIEKELAHCEEVLVANNAIIKNVGMQDGESESLAQSLETKREELSKVKNRVFIYEKIRETMEEAQRQTMTSVRDILQDKIEEYLPIITNGRYQKVRVGANLEIEVFSEEFGDFLDPRDYLSRGTIDQIFLVARFALALAQSEGKYPPFILDDPFVTFDSTRKREAAKLVKELSKDFQVFLMTYANEYNEFADTTVDLSRNT